MTSYEQSPRYSTDTIIRVNHNMKKDWKLFTGNRTPRDITEFPKSPPWRRFEDRLTEPDRKLPDEDDLQRMAKLGKGDRFEANDAVKEMVNAALYLRRPLLVEGKPGTGKSSLIHAVAYELKLGDVLEWPINSRSTLKDGLYIYDAIGRLQEQQRTQKETDISAFLQLGPLGTALLPTNRPRALLIDEIDKSDLDLPNDLLNVFEKGGFYIPELQRFKTDKPVPIRDFTGRETFKIEHGYVRCHEFPFVVLTSNGEREFPAPFLRRCLRLTMPNPDEEQLKKIVSLHLGEKATSEAQGLISEFMGKIKGKEESLATDQLLNAIYLINGNHGVNDEDERKRLIAALLKALTT